MAEATMGAEVFLRGLGIPGDVAAIALGQPEQTQALRHVAALLEQPKRKALVLWGAPGAGKTVAQAFWLAQVGHYCGAPDSPEGWLYLRERTAYVKAYELGRLNLRFNADDRHAFVGMKQVRWLAIDDLGAEETASTPLVEELVDHRTACGLWTLISTNFVCGPDLDRSPFHTRYGARTVDRLAAAGGFVSCGSRNLRREARS